MKQKCSVKGCRRVGCLKGFCRLHYQRNRLGYKMDAPVKKRIKGPVDKRLRAYLKIDEATGCHLWTGARDLFGYGIMMMNRSKIHRAHRVAFEVANGPIPEGKVVMHICDNPPCCNPEHLQLGTRAENNRDRFAKKRGAGCRKRDLERNPQWGCSHPHAKDRRACSEAHKDGSAALPSPSEQGSG